MKIILLASVTFSYFSFTMSYNALIFNPKEKSLIEIPSEVSKTAICDGEWVSACPATNTNDEEFNKKKSFNENALFVQHIYNTQDLQIDVLKETCDKPFKLSVAMFEQLPLFYEFGYEIYFDQSQSEKFESSNKGLYRSLEDSLNKSKLLKRLFLAPVDAIKYTKKKDERALMKKQGDKGFVWIPLFKVKYWHRQLRKIQYVIRKNNRDPMTNCEDYSLGKEMFYNINVDSLYSKEVQEKIMKTVKLPEKFITGDCESQFICFERWSLIPTDQFQFGSSTRPTCSDMTTVPIWSNLTKKILIAVDYFLNALSRVSGKSLRIVAGPGVHKYLRFSTKSWRPAKRIITLKKDGFTLFVPRIIFKIVKFKLTTQECPKKSFTCWYGIVIVIHNDPNYDGEKKICEDKTEDLGWEDITNTYESESFLRAGIKTKSKHIYVCAIRENTIENLGLKYNNQLSIKELSLKRFPYTEKNDLKHIDIRAKLSNELRGISSPRRQTSGDKKAIKLPPLDDDNDFLNVE